MPAVGGFVFDSSGAPADREVRLYRRDTGALLGKTRSSGGDSDPHFDNVSLLLHMDGEDGSTTFTDSSATPKVATAYGNAKISTAQSKFGPSSGLLDGYGDFLHVVSSAEFGFGVGDFTVESWFYPLSAQTGVIVDARVNNTAELWFVYWDLQKINFYTPSATLTSTSTASLNTWHHFSVTQQSGVLRLFIDGALAGTSTNTSYLGDSVPICVGANPAGKSNLHGYIDDLRITKGVARYTANFTPPAARLPDIPGTGGTLAFGEYYFQTQHTGEVNVVCLDDASATLENDLILRTFTV